MNKGEKRMIPNIGIPELILILVVALIIFGPGKLPDVGKSLGKTIREFRKSSSEISSDIMEAKVKDVEEIKSEPKAIDSGKIEYHSDEDDRMKGEVTKG
ncbi:MAG: twin-arginine translocase TatA/TatE family subunit [Clostridia bacterium]|nr:twin-arginine translocase TatA/TatE family subunit [Clostridia bacterium]